MPDETDVQPIWERLEGEPNNWYARFLLYRNMKATDRSLLAAVNEWLVLKKIDEISALPLSAQEKSELFRDIEGQIRAYKNAPGAWRRSAEKYDWKFRAEQYDAHLQAEQEKRQQVLREVEAAEIERIMTTGYAAKHKRIEALASMADLIKLSFLSEEDNKVNFAWVTPDKIREFRGCMDDIAKELGDRVNKKELTGKDGGPIAFTTEWGGGALASDEEVSEG